MYLEIGKALIKEAPAALKLATEAAETLAGIAGRTVGWGSEALPEARAITKGLGPERERAVALLHTMNIGVENPAALKVTQIGSKTMYSGTEFTLGSNSFIRLPKVETMAEGFDQAPSYLAGSREAWKKLPELMREFPGPVRVRNLPGEQTTLLSRAEELKFRLGEVDPKTQFPTDLLLAGDGKNRFIFSWGHNDWGLETTRAILPPSLPAEAVLPTSNLPANLLSRLGI